MSLCLATSQIFDLGEMCNYPESVAHIDYIHLFGLLLQYITTPPYLSSTE